MKGFIINRQRMTQGILLLGITVFFIQRFRIGDIVMLVSPAIAVIVRIGTILCAILTVVTLKGAVLRPTEASPSNPGNHHLRDNQHQHRYNLDHGSEHGHQHTTTTWGERAGIIMCIITAAAAISWKPQALGTEMIPAGANAPAVHIDPSRLTAPGSVNDLSALGIAADPAGTISQASIAENFVSNPSKYWGKHVTLQGFVYHPQGLPTNDFILTRYFIFCCIADATPFGITVESDQATTLTAGEWVSVEGTIQPAHLPILDRFQPTSWHVGASSQPVVVGSKIAPIPVPKQPYLLLQ